ncbi:ZCHC3 protein, partial [Atractosteus spatula]|nr:ZCHC3 protein [Atractosteus spatula]
LQVHMLNPFVPEEEILFFLRRFVDIQGPGHKVLDAGGYWNCRRKYLARFRSNAALGGAVVHPPASFMIGSNRGYLFYPGQPGGCRRCGKEGHVVVNCPSMICRRCGVEGHVVSNCTAEITCNLCG